MNEHILTVMISAGLGTFISGIFHFVDKFINLQAAKKAKIEEERFKYIIVKGKGYI